VIVEPRTEGLRRCAGLLFLLWVTPLMTARAQDADPVPRVLVTATDIRLDGSLDEPAWARADSITDFRQKEPSEGGSPTARTVVRLLATPAGLAIGWWLSDPAPAALRRSQLRRDADQRSDDHVAVMIDGLSDRRSAFFFRTNPNGALWDGEHVTFESGNDEWDGIWDVRTRITVDGWTVEMLIPWATLRYPDDLRSMRMNFRRFLPRTNEELLWRAWKRGQGIRFLEEAGVVEGFDRSPARARAELRPFVLGEHTLPERTFAADGSDQVVVGTRNHVATGLDVKIPVTSTLTADLTVLPDFAQAEVDRQVVNLTRFPLFFPEQRPFFTEGASNFAFGRQQQSQMFYSRRIGLGPGGLPVEIPVGARVQGRAGRYRLGLLAARTGDEQSATDLVARVRRDVLGRGYIGGMTTYSDQAARPGALAAGVDFDLPFIIRRRDNLVFLGNAAWSRDSIGGASGSHLRFVVDYPNDHADLVTRFDRIEAGYDPALGFISQNGIYRWGGNMAVTPRPKRASVIRRYEFNLLGYEVIWDLEKRLDNANFTIRPFGAQFQSGDRVELNLIRRFDGPTEDFDLVPGVTVVPGEYWFDRVEARYSGSNVRRWTINASASTGEFYDGRRVDLALAGFVRMQPHVELSLDLSQNDVRLPAGDFVVNTVRFRGDYAVSPRLTATAFAQFDDQSERAAVNARLRWTTSPGSDLYVVWNSAWPTGLDRGIPWDRPVRGGLVVKYVRFLRY
jgi:Domain of unknown function (DUF5916)